MEMAATTQTAKPSRFLALGGLWLDEIRSVGKQTKFDVLGGSVAFGNRTANLFSRIL